MTELKVVATVGSLRLVGDLGPDAGPALRDAVDDVLDATSGELRVDVAGVGFVDTDAARVLVEPTRLGHPVVLVGASPQLRALLELHDLADGVELVP